MNQKIFIAFFAVLVIGIIGYFVLVKNQTPTSQTQQTVFASQEECEQKTAKSCSFQMCDYVPSGKTFEEVCGKDFKKGWTPNTSAQKPSGAEIDYPVDGIEDGGYGGTAFCSIVNHSSFELKNHSITINGNGPYAIKIDEMRNTFSPYEYPNVKLITHLRFENKENSYADTLYFGNDNNLYNCHGGV